EGRAVDVLTFDAASRGRFRVGAALLQALPCGVEVDTAFRDAIGDFLRTSRIAGAEESLERRVDRIRRRSAGREDEDGENDGADHHAAYCTHRQRPPSGGLTGQSRSAS